jgi:hypothetical protein
MNTPVTLEIAKALKGKGFDEDCYRTYSNDKISPFPLLENMGGEPILNPLDYKWRNSLIHESVVSAPTITDTIIWILEKHNIWIHVGNYGADFSKWSWGITKKDHGIVNTLDPFNPKSNIKDSPTEAYLSAIEYTINNLI